MKEFHLLKNSLILLRIFKHSGRFHNHAVIASDKVKLNVEDNYQEAALSSDSAEQCFPRRVPLTAEEYQSRKSSTLVQPADPHLLKVALVGDPNAGKSTLANSLVKWKVCAVSKKVHTTRVKSAAVLVEGNRQIVFLDTPGSITPEHSKRHKLEVSLVSDAKHSATSADLIAVVIDASNKWTNKTISPSVLLLLENMRDKTSVLILNKVDAVKAKDELLDITRILTQQTNGNKIETSRSDGECANKQEDKKAEIVVPKYFPSVTKDCETQGWPHFSEVFMVSALQNKGVEKLREFMLSLAQPSPWIFHSSDVTDQHPHNIVVHLIREKLLDYLPKEIPYGLSVKVTSWTLEPSGSLKITVVIKCPNARHKKFVIGRSGLRISQCVQSSRQAVADAFRCEVLLKIEVK